MAFWVSMENHVALFLPPPPMAAAADMAAAAEAEVMVEVQRWAIWIGSQWEGRPGQREQCHQ